ncbi:MAG TPA: GNAT family N-acetyltransferase [Ktedonobacterales bacterium]|nr:GNAT family N-acetyltransferase [Ktedonobacterales bacterium]
MLKDGALTVRELSASDLPAVRRLVTTSEYIYCRFGLEELPRLLAHKPGVAAFSGQSLQAFLLTNILAPPAAWLGGFGVVWSEGNHFTRYLDLLLPAYMAAVRRAGATGLYYTGGDLDSDWLKDILLVRQFDLLTTLRSYDKEDYSIPTEGNQQVTVRPFQRADVNELLQVEQACFDHYWRYDAASFLEIADTYPYFVVAVQDGRVIGYQFNTVDAGMGFLVRIAVHPSLNSRGIGARLMAEAVRFFQAERVWKIALNTEEKNHHAHRLYEWFGFHYTPPQGFVLERPLIHR